MINKFLKQVLISAFFSLVFFSLAFAGTELQGIDSKESYKRVMDSPSNTFIVDVRTKAEYEFVGHPDLPNGVPNVPYKFYPTWELNKDFVEKVKSRYKMDDTIITMCRSGKSGYQVEEIEKESYGTDIIIHLNEDGEKFSNRWEIQNIVKKYSNHISFPIYLTWEEVTTMGEGEKKKEKKEQKTEQINAGSAFWKKSKASLKKKHLLFSTRSGGVLLRSQLLAMATLPLRHLAGELLELLSWCLGSACLECLPPLSPASL